MKMKYKDVPVFIIHLPMSTDREPFIEKLKTQFSNVRIIEAIHWGDIENPDYYLDMKNFTRMPTLKPRNLLARVACFLSHRKALQTISYEMEHNGLENAIILEDDAILVDESLLDQEVSGEDMILLGYKQTKDQKKIVGTWSIFYKNSTVVDGILASMSCFKWKAFDLWLNINVYPYLDVKYCKFFEDGSACRSELKSIISEGMGKKYHKNIV